MQHKFLLYLAFVALIFSSCSKYGYVSLNYPTPPENTLPENIRSIAMVNRSLTPEEAKKDKVIESIATAEIAGVDERASDESLRGVFDEMNGLYGMRIIIPERSRYYGTGTRKTPELLAWDTVAAICEANRADALLVLETFDSNSDLMLSTATNTVNALLSGNVPNPAAPRQVNMNVECYWRLYDPQTREIIDHFGHKSYMTFDTYNPVLEVNALPQTAYLAGQEYAYRFMPGYYKVRRKLYSKAKGPGKHQFNAGYRQTEVANWEGAIESWIAFVDNAKPKSAGRACLNIAVAYEVLGNTEEALKWARRGYTDYNDELARSYAKVLLQRQTLEY